MQRKLLVIAVITALIAPIGVMSPSASAEDNIDELKEQIKALQARVEQLESQNQPPADEGDDSWDYFNRRRPRRWDPFAEMDRMQAEMNRMFEHAFSNRPMNSGGMFSSSMGYNYNVDMKETDDGYEITFDMKGLDKDKVDIQINSNSITIKGEHSSEDTEKGPNQFYQTQSFGSFMQTIPLPTDADTAGVKTEKKGDSLVITMPKKNS